MFASNKREPTKLEEAIDEIFSDMGGFTSDAKEYGAMTDQLEKLYKLKEIDRPKRVSPDTLIIAATNILGILVIVHHERLNVVTSKAMTLLPKLR